MMKNILSFEWKLFVRSKTEVLVWLFMLASGLYAIFYGASFRQRQQDVISRLDSSYTARIEKQLDGFSADTATQEGKTAYRYSTDPFLNENRVGTTVWKAPEPLQTLSMGQSDNQPFYYNLWVYRNVYLSGHGELRNPDKLLAGNFDLAFVFLYLFPLLIIVYTYSAVSKDKEAGIAPLLIAQGTSLRNFLTARLLFRFLIVFVLVILLSVAGYWINKVPFATFLPWLLIVTVYLVFWFSVAYLVLSFRKSSAVSALILVGIWVFFLFFIPSALNNQYRPEDPENVHLSDLSREYRGGLWEMDKARLIDTLFRVKPEWARYSVKDTNVVRSVAYSYLNMLKLNEEGRRIDSAMITEQKKFRRLDIINPAFSVQRALNNLARTETDFYVAFRKDASDYQEKRVEVIHDYRLSGRKFIREDFLGLPQFQVTENRWELKAVLPVLVLTVVVLALGVIRWKRISPTTL